MCDATMSLRLRTARDERRRPHERGKYLSLMRAGEGESQVQSDDAEGENRGGRKELNAFLISLARLSSSLLSFSFRYHLLKLNPRLNQRSPYKTPIYIKKGSERNTSRISLSSKLASSPPSLRPSPSPSSLSLFRLFAMSTVSSSSLMFAPPSGH